MMIRGIENLTLPEIEREIESGGRFVYYEYCISLIVVSTRRPSAIYFLRGNDWGLLRGLPYCVLSFCLGWWGLLWGVIWTPLTLFNNLCGGCDATPEVLTWLHAQESEDTEPETRNPPCDAS